MKRSYLKIETPVTIALKSIRNSKNVSLRKLGKRMGISESCISDRENGRIEEISNGYIEKFVSALGYSMNDWADFVEGKTTAFDLRRNCVNLLEKMDKSKLVSVHLFLQSFTN